MTTQGGDLERRVGTTLCGKWTLTRLLGAGGMAAVYLARHKIGRLDAIKILHTDLCRVPEVRERFEREARAANRLRHPGAVEIRDIDVTEDGAPFLVMELVEGETLSARERRAGPLPRDELLRIADELLDVLAAAHAQGIIHRDIKPENLCITPDGTLRVLDFGIAKLLPLADGTPSSYRTHSGATIGTAAYMPPEQVRGLDVDARADLFAVGATMFRVASGRRVHEAATEGELLVLMATEPAPALASVASGADPDLCKVVDRALAMDRMHRYPDAATMQEDVRALRRGEAPPWASDAARSAPSTLPVIDRGRAPVLEVLQTEASGALDPTRPAASTERDGSNPSTTGRVALAVHATVASPAAPGPAVGLARGATWRRAERVVCLGVGIPVAGAALLFLWISADLALKGSFNHVAWGITLALGTVATLLLLRARSLSRGIESPSDEAVRTVLRFARDHQGRATASGIAADTRLSVTEAARVLEDLARLGSCEPVRVDGGLVYRFAQLAPSAAATPPAERTPS